MARRGRTAIQWLTARERRWIVLATLTALALRVAWVLWVSAEPRDTGSDTGRMLAMARQFADGETYRLNGIVTAFHSPGYPALLTPLAWLSERTGWFSLPLAAGLVNAVAGTGTVVCGGVLAHRWLGREAGIAAGWLLALAPGPIYLTSTALTETVFTAVVLASLVVLVTIEERPGPPSFRRLVMLGALIGYATLVRTTALLVLLVVVIALWGRPWRRIPRLGDRSLPAWVVAVVAVVIVLTPWTIRNGIQVGVWSPAATSNAAFLCNGHGDDALADATEIPEAEFARCFRGTPYDPATTDEDAWYSQTLEDAVVWAIQHPGDEVRLTAEKTVVLFRSDSQALGDARDFGTREIASVEATRLLDRLGELWHRSVLVLAGLAVLTVRRVRQLRTLWLVAGGFTLVALSGTILDRMHHTIMPMLVIAASGLVLQASTLGPRVLALGRPVRRFAADVVRPPAQEVGRDPTPMAVPFPAQVRYALDHTIRAFTLGTLVAIVVFDVISAVAGTPVVYTRGAWLLSGLALGGAATTSLIEILRRRPASALVLLGLADMAIASGWLLRRAEGFAADARSPAAAAVVTVAALGLLIFSRRPMPRRPAPGRSSRRRAPTADEPSGPTARPTPRGA